MNFFSVLSVDVYNTFVWQREYALVRSGKTVQIEGKRVFSMEAVIVADIWSTRSASVSEEEKESKKEH